MDTAPKFGDCNNVLLAKIVQVLSNKHSAPQLAPHAGDSDNRLLFKWAALLAQYGP